MPHKILIVDDVPEMGELIRLTIQEGIPDCEVRVVRSVFEAERAILRDRPDLLFLDEIIPGEIPTQLLSLPSLEGTRVILITASAQEGRPLPRGAHSRWAKWGWKEIREARARIAELLNQG
jgi:CheY-like chemotaxis protein